MKKILGTALIFALVLILATPLAVLALPNKFGLDVPYGEPATSGIGADWGTPFKATPDSMGWGGEIDNGIPFDYYLLWSEKGLYVAMDISMPFDVARNDGSALEASHGGNCDRFQLAFNPGNDRPAEEAPVWFTFSALEDGAFHIVREDAQYGEVDDVTAQCPGTAIIDGGRLQTAFMIPWEVININSAQFTAGPGLKMDIHVGICFAGDNATVVGAQKIEIADAADDLPNVWVVGAMPITMTMLAQPAPEPEPESEPEPEAATEPEAAPEPAPDAPAPAPAPTPAPGTGNAAILSLILLLAVASLVYAVAKKRA